MSGYGTGRAAGVAKGKAKGARIKAHSVWDELDFITKDSQQNLQTIQDRSDTLMTALQTVQLMDMDKKSEISHEEDLKMVAEHYAKEDWELTKDVDNRNWFQRLFGKRPGYTFTSGGYEMKKSYADITLKAHELRGTNMLDEAEGKFQTEESDNIIGPLPSDSENKRDHNLEVKTKPVNTKRAKNPPPVPDADDLEIDWDNMENWDWDSLWKEETKTIQKKKSKANPNYVSPYNLGSKGG